VPSIACQSLAILLAMRSLFATLRAAGTAVVFLTGHVTAVSTPARMAEATRVVGALFPAADAYTKRVALGRAAQLGCGGNAAPPFVYRPGAIGCAVDSSLTYGEFDLLFFATLTNEAFTRGGRSPEGQTFVDVGSGCGRLVFAAAALWPSLARCVGIEMVESLHALAVDAAPRASTLIAEESVASDIRGDRRAAAAVQLIREDALQGLAAVADGKPVCAFAYSSAYASIGITLTDFSLACSGLPAGSRVVTIDKLLAVDDPCLEGTTLLLTLEGPNAETGGTSLGYVWEIGEGRQESAAGSERR